MASGSKIPVTPDGQQASVAALEAAQAGKQAGWDWGTLEAAVVMPNKQTPANIKVDVIASVHEAIRQRAEASLGINTERVKAASGSNATRKRVDYHWELQPVSSEEQGAAFIKAIIKYAKYRPADVDVPHAVATSPKGQVTARTGVCMKFAKADDGTYAATVKDDPKGFWGVRYSVRPFEMRSGTAKLPGA